MGYKITCQKKSVGNVKKYNVMCSDDYISHIIYVSELCQQCGSKNDGCRTCYGKIVRSVRTFFDNKTNMHKSIEEVLIDKYSSKKGRVKKHLNATDFLSRCTIIHEIVEEFNPLKQKVTNPWTAYDRESGWENKCNNCRKKYSKTPCENGEVCREQGQRKVLIY